jgi:hypothetical protein
MVFEMSLMVSKLALVSCFSCFYTDKITLLFLTETSWFDLISASPIDRLDPFDFVFSLETLVFIELMNLRWSISLSSIYSCCRYLP